MYETVPFSAGPILPPALMIAAKISASSNVDEVPESVKLAFKVVVALLLPLCTIVN